MILSGLEIKKRIGRDIVIDPFDEKQLNPNSYNLRLHDQMLTYSRFPLDCRSENPTRRITIPSTGLQLEPQRLYLGRTKEYTKTEAVVPMIEGRSSIGRLGLFVHITAGFGDVGFSGFWTLEMYCIHPVIIYPDLEICQIFYHAIQGEYRSYDGGKYQNNTDIQPSLLYKEFEDGD